MGALASHAHFENLGAVEWALVGLAVLIGAWSIWLAVRYTLEPGEDDPNHVKRSILDDRTIVTVQTAPPPVPPGAQDRR